MKFAADICHLHFDGVVVDAGVVISKLSLSDACFVHKSSESNRYGVLVEFSFSM